MLRSGRPQRVYESCCHCPNDNATWFFSEPINEAVIQRRTKLSTSFPPWNNSYGKDDMSEARSRKRSADC